MVGGTARISNAQLVAGIGISQSIAGVLFLPALLIQAAGRDAWLSMGAALLIGAVPSALLVGALVRYHPNRPFGEIAESCLGRWAGRLLTLVLALMNLVVASLSLEDVINFIPTTVLPGTPDWVVGGTFALVALYAAYLGAEVIVRGATLMLIAMGSFAILVFTGLTPVFMPIHIQPILGEGLLKVLKGGLIPAGWMAEIWFYTELLALLDRPRLAGRTLILGSAIGATILGLVTLMVTMAFGPELGAHLTYPSFSLVQHLTLGEFLERLEIVIITLWVVGILLKTSVHLWVSHIALSRVLGIGNARKVLPWVAAAGLGLTFLNPNIITLGEFDRHYWTPLSLPLSIAIPGLLLVLSWWKAHSGKGRRDLNA